MQRAIVNEEACNGDPVVGGPAVDDELEELHRFAIDPIISSNDRPAPIFVSEDEPDHPAVRSVPEMVPGNSCAR